MDKTLKLEKIPEWAVYPVLEGIPFFKLALRKDPEQIKFILANTLIQEVASGEVLIRRGDIDNNIFFVVLGHLQVYSDNDSRFPVDTIAQGEMFGEIAMITNLQRSSTVVGDINSRKILVVKTDFSPFGELYDLRRISLQTKLVFYQIIVESIQKRVDNFIRQYPEFVVAHPMHPIAPFTGKPGTMEEVAHHYEKARKLALSLTEWNHQLARVFDVEGKPQVAGLKTIITLMTQQKARSVSNKDISALKNPAAPPTKGGTPVAKPQTPQPQAMRPPQNPANNPLLAHLNPKLVVGKK